MALTVALVAYPLAPVGPDAVGGAEQVVTRLDDGLLARGHRVIVIACEGSRARWSRRACAATRRYPDRAAREGARVVVARDRPTRRRLLTRLA